METIFAPICALGGSIISVRFSGKDAFKVLDFFEVDKGIYQKKDLFFTQLKYNNKIFDEVVIKIFREPNSFTGENVVEIDLHASIIILQDFLKLVSTINNFRFAKNGEFSRRAFLNGKISLIKSEGINAIIRSETKQQQLLANEMFYGNINKQYNDIRNRLIEALSYVETQIDFSEEEVPQNVINNVKEITDDLINKISTCLDDKRSIDKINKGIIISIIGEPNVGKSSLLNWLAKRDIAIVSPIAGTTRDAISTEIELDGYKVIFYDTAGIRDTEDIIEKEGVKRAKNIAKDSDLCIFICDNIDDIGKLIEEHKNYNNDCIFVINKIDLIDKNITNNDIKQQKDYVNNDIDVVQISVLKQQNLDVLLDIIKEKILKKVELKTNPLVINERHSLLLTECVNSLKDINFDTMPIEIIGEEIKYAIDRIGQITGRIYTDDILDNVFSKFCIGK